MQQTTSTPGKVVLTGAWTMDQAVEGLSFLALALQDQLEATPPPTSTEVDLSQVRELDACGCQLLAVFLENLKGNGILPVPHGLAPALFDTTRLLGFAGLLGAQDGPKET
ncbi:hypothetical protein GMLC_32210 [Geomonas limicola]|uniref:MlaB-like STAS domain-containing protein n=1 Tax=Geomonas limicola TaxID=2740186 RepID=A0A6V8NAK1_9BACT|nr:STAS domain-containing protein [Geomonas limicola]GFO69642.1 hypothetical protein GMLC_32210 [Geomonas limicola]